MNSPNAMKLETSREEFIRLNACVLLPTYNNAGSLAAVLNDLLEYTDRIIVINDGSTDTTIDILQKFPQLNIVSYHPNKGKGYALRQGLKAAATAGFEYAISIDSDGQHYASDLPVFLDEIEKTPGALLVGGRNMNVDHVPGKSSFGKRFSNFWYWVNTGINLPDTQSGYRLYPVVPLARKRFFTRKYEFEIEVLVRAAWSGIEVRSVPVSVYYPPADERVTHFRPFKDFTRISILNTVLVTIALLWIKPRDFVLSLTKAEGWRSLWKSLFLHPEESNLQKALSVGFGVFMGIVPIWGLQLAIGIPLAILFRLNKALFLIAANISIFPLTAVWLFLSLATGNWLLGQPLIDLRVWDITLDYVRQQGFAFLLGGSVLALTMGLFAFLSSWAMLAIFRKSER